MRREKSKTQVESSNPIVRFVKENSGIIIALMALCIILSIMVPDKFLTYNNFTTVLRSISTTAIMAFGMTFVIITGGIDLSVGSIVALSGTLCAGLISSSWNYAAAVIIGLAVGTLCGAFNGFVISRTEIPPFIVTRFRNNGHDEYCPGRQLYLLIRKANSYSG